MADSLELIVSTSHYWPYILACYGMVILVFLLNILFSILQYKKTLTMLKQREKLQSTDYVNPS